MEKKKKEEEERKRILIYKYRKSMEFGQNL